MGIQYIGTSSTFSSIIHSQFPIAGTSTPSTIFLSHALALALAARVTGLLREAPIG